MDWNTESYRNGVVAGVQVLHAPDTEAQVFAMRTTLRDNLDDDAFLAGFIDGVTD